MYTGRYKFSKYFFLIITGGGKEDVGKCKQTHKIISLLQYNFSYQQYDSTKHIPAKGKVIVKKSMPTERLGALPKCGNVINCSKRQ